MELAFSPSGHLYLRQEPPAGDRAEEAPATARCLTRAFAAGQAEGLLTLASERLDGALGPAWAYWRHFAARYLTALCQTPETAEMAAVPPPDDLAEVALNAPPMPGAEYLSAATLRGVWEDLDSWIRQQIAAGEGGLSGFLQRQAPLWHQVGRVCFHLAENRRNADYPFAFLATYAPGVAAHARVQYQPLSRALRELAGARNKPALVRLLSPVERAAQKSALVRELVESGDLYQPLAWTPAQAYRFLREVPLFEESGLLVRMPDWWKKRPRPRVAVSIGSAGSQTFAAEELLDFQVEVALGDATLSAAEWRQLLAAEDGLVLLRGQWVEVDRQRLQEALDHWKRVEEEFDEGVSFLEGMRLLAGMPDERMDDGGSDRDRQWAFVQAGPWLADLLAKMRSPENLPREAWGARVQARLRPYQETGVRWLRFLTGLGLGACLADDMGLGKTLQVLALLATPRSPAAGKPSLLVLPASLLANWKAEMTRFTPSLRPRFVHPSEASKEELERWAAAPEEALKQADLIVTSYGMLLRQSWLLEVSWPLVILDEAQAIKNPSARQTKAVKRLRASARIALTGTPLENRLSDLWSLFDFLCPGLLGSAAKFKRVVKTLGEGENRYAPLRSLVQPYLLRRMKTDRRIIDDLPDKVEVAAYCNLSKRQAALYAQTVGELAEGLQGAEGMRRRGLVLASLMRLKQLCNHPSHLLGDGRFAPEESGKFVRLAELGEEIAARQERVLVFTQFREMTDPLAAFLAQVFGRPGLVLHGATAVGRRQALVDQFQRDDGPPFFVLSLKAGGTGLNLTAASHVVHFDRWWNPAVENQATDRAFRIGQHRNVVVHKFVCRGTIEERIDALIDQKRQLATELLEGGAEKLLTEMSDAELLHFVSLDVARAVG